MDMINISLASIATHEDVHSTVTVTCSLPGVIVTFGSNYLEAGRIVWEDINDMEIIAKKLGFLRVFEFQVAVELLGKAARMKAAE